MCCIYFVDYFVTEHDIVQDSASSISCVVLMDFIIVA